MTRVFHLALGFALASGLACNGDDHGVGVCGNAVREADIGEECDDGAENADDGACTHACKAARCGDGLVQAGVELCDEGRDNRDEGPCTPLCAPPTCGDGLLQGPELCDDGDENKPIADGLGGCSQNCVPLPVCGDGVVHPEFEECDDGNKSDSDECTSACTLPVCGDGIQQPGEACDDGNDIETDNCSSACEYPTCGDGFIWEGMEECEDGNDNNNDGCLNICKKNTCGDGARWDGVEECDDGNLIDDDGCNAECFRDRLVFVTDQTYSVSDLGSLELAYLRCSQQAAKYGLSKPTKYRAWLSDGVDSPSTRFDLTKGRFVLSTGQVIANGWEDLTDGELLHPIDRTANGTLIEGPVWTGTKADGTSFADGHCNGWTESGDEVPRHGFSDLADEGWTSLDPGPFPPSCSSTLFLYCFEARL